MIFIHNMQNRKQCKVILRYLLEIYAFDDFGQTVFDDDNTPNATGDCVKKSLQEVENT